MNTNPNQDRIDAVRRIVFGIMVKEWPARLSWNAAKVWCNRKGDKGMNMFVEKYQVPVITDPENGYRSIATWDLLVAVVLEGSENSTGGLSVLDLQEIKNPPVIAG